MLASWLVIQSAAMAGTIRWEPGPVERIADRPVTDLELLDGRLAVLGPDGLTVGGTSFPVHGTQLTSTGDDLVVCGPQGVLLVRDPVEHTTREPCTAVGFFGGDIVAALPRGVTLLGNPPRTVLPVDGVRALAGAPGRMAALGSTLVVAERGEVALLPTPSDVVDIVPSTDGWWTAIAGVRPRVVGPEEVVLRSAPRSLHATLLEDDDDWVVGTQQGLIARVAGRLVPLELGPIDTVVSGDLDGDGCVDLVAGGPDGAWSIPGRCTRETRPTGPQKITLWDSWARVELQEGDAAQLQMVDARGATRRFAAQGAPSWLRVTPDGQIMIDDAQPGVWRVSVRVGDGDAKRWTGLVLDVEPLAVEATDATPRRVHHVPAGPWSVRECFLEVGVAGGLTHNPRTAWNAVGLPDQVASVSPAGAMSCSGGGGKLRWFAGVDAAPGVTWYGAGGTMRHALGASFGIEAHSERLRVGPYVNGGVLFFGVGVRGLWLPFETIRGTRHGLAVRALASPVALAGSVMLGYTVEFGER